jgi:GH24 family phage-related lysozyme (muramidase)
MINIPNIADIVNKIVNSKVNGFFGKYQKVFSDSVVKVFDTTIALPPVLPLPPTPEVPIPETPAEVPAISDEDKQTMGDSGSEPPKPVGAPVIWDKDGNLISDTNIVIPPPENPPVKFEVAPVFPPPTTEELNTEYPPQTSTQVAKTTLPGTYSSPSVYTASIGIRNLIKSHETLQLKIYPDPDGVHADIGWGHVLGLWSDRASLPQTITTAQAEAYFAQDIREAEADVKRVLRQKCTQGQFDSFVDLAYSAGGGWLQKSETLATFNRGDICGCGKLYTKAAVTGNGKPLSALVTRRKTVYYNYYTNNWGVTQCTA